MSMVDLAGVDVRLEQEDPDSGGDAAALFAACAPSGASEAQITIVRRTAPLAPPETPPSDVTDDASYWLSESGVFARHHDGICGGRLGDTIVVGGVSHGPDPSRAFRLAVQMPLADALSQHGRHVLHAAAVERHGCVVVVTGPSGAGKSTFAYAAGRAGWNVIGDDLVVLAGPEPLALWSFPKPLHVPGDMLDVAGADAVVALPGDARQRRVLSPPAQVHGGRRVAAVVAVGHSAGLAGWSAVRTEAAWATEILLSFSMVDLPSRARQLLPIAAALSRRPRFVYQHDADPARRTDAVERFLRQVVSEIGSMSDQ
jgi:hypothetical protein